MKVPWDFEPPGLERAKLQRAWGKLIYEYADWTWWANLTFRDDMSEQGALRVLIKWLRYLAKDSGTHFRVAYAIEAAGQSHHIHALLAFSPKTLFSTRALNQSWRGVDSTTGFTDIRKYDSNRGAAWYLAKEGQCEVGTVCPRPPSCRRRGSCKIAKSPL